MSDFRVDEAVVSTARDQPAALRVYEALKAEILAGAIEPGGQLRETPLSARFAVSRTPIREALQRLVADGLAEGEGGHVVVTRFAFEDLLDFYGLLSVVQGHVTRLVAERATDEEIVRLGASLKDSVALARAGELEGLRARTREFEAALESATHSPRVERLNQQLFMSGLLAHGATVTLERLKERLAGHRAMITAVKRRDADAAERAGRDHILRIRYRYFLGGGPPPRALRRG